jgi:hypothetical protein
VPLDCKISHDEQIVHAVAIGEVSADEIQAFLGSVIAAHAMPYAKLFDISQGTALANSGRLSEVGDTARLYDKMKLGPMGALAIVADTALQRVSHAEAFVVAASARRPVRLFQTAEEAWAWLAALRPVTKD